MNPVFAITLNRNAVSFSRQIAAANRHPGQISTISMFPDVICSSNHKAFSKENDSALAGARSQNMGG
jgi:hypothetical protein